MTTHLVRISGSIAAIVLGTFAPFLPGQHDPLAVPLSSIMQAFSVLGLLFVPIGAVWLGYELRQRQRRQIGVLVPTKRYHFALVSVVAFAVVAISVSLGAFMVIGPSAGVLGLALCALVVWRLRPRLKALRGGSVDQFNAVPIYLVAIPTMVMLLQVALARAAIEFSRNHAIDHSAELIADLERYRAAYGAYPEFLAAVHKDYHPSVAGIDRYHYAPHADGYNLFFERPALLLDFGLREFVVFNARDEHLLISHAAWIMAGPARELVRRQGRPAVHDTSRPHWKYFWFD